VILRLPDIFPVIPTESADVTPSQKQAVKRHRKLQVKKGQIRLELNVPAQDREMLRSVATELRKGGYFAERMRAVLTSTLAGEELLDFKKFLELAPLDGVDLERSKETGWRDIDL
jgi:hypothetical protein